MAGKRPRTERRVAERAARKHVQDVERLWAMSPGGEAARPITVDSAAVIEVRVASMRCPQCEGEYALRAHDAAGSGVRVVSVVCRQCHAPRRIWFRLGSSSPN